MINNLLGDEEIKMPKRQGEEKTIYFSKIIYRELDQYDLDGNLQQINLYTLFEKGFNEICSNCIKEKGELSYTCEYEKKKYIINIIELNKNFCFGKLSSEKEYKDILEEYRSDNIEKIKFIIIKSFTFFYVDFKSKSLVYIGHKNLRNINEIFRQYFRINMDFNLLIKPYSEEDTIEKINKSKIIKSIDFNLVPNAIISQSIDQTLEWCRDIEQYEVKIKIKHPKKRYIKELMEDNNKLIKIEKPKVSLIDENCNEQITHLFENYFTIKENISIDEMDLEHFSKIRDKLIIAHEKYILKKG